MKKKLLTLLLSIVVILTSTVTVFADGTGTQSSPWEIGASGNESGVTAYLDGDVLYINGSGQMKSQAVGSWPWYSVKDTITTAVIADGITNIGKSVLRECSNLSAVSIPNSVTTIDSTTFYEDTNLANIVLPNALTQIGSGAFRYSGLTSIVIPATVTSIGSEAFEYCNSLSSVKVLSTTPPSINDNTFTNSDPLQIYVSKESVDTYKAATNWSALKDRIQAIPSHTHGTGTEAITFEKEIKTFAELHDLFATGGSGYFANDITATAGLTVEANIDLCLNGKKLNLDGKGNITVSSGKTLNLYDCGTNGTITGGNAEHGGGVYVNNGTFNMYGGVITNNETANNKNGGGVYVNGGTFIMDGGKIAGNKATGNGYGAGVYVNTGTFEMTGNSVVSNNTGGQGAGVYSKGTFTMSGNSEITGNTGTLGGGVGIGGGTFTMTESSKIANNKGNGCGGVYIYAGSFKMTGGTITGNTATGYGGVSIMSGGSFEMTGGTITGNTATSCGGVFDSGIITLGSSANITGNVKGGTITGGVLTGGTVSNVLLNNKQITIGTKSASSEGNSVAAPTDNFKVGVTTATAPTETAPIKITTNGASTDTNYFASDNDAYEVKFNTDHLELAVKTTPSYTIADILPDDFPTCVDVLPPNLWVNGNEVNMMVIPSSLVIFTLDGDGNPDYVELANDIRTATLTKNGNNYTYTNNGVTTTFLMSDNGLESVKIEGLTGEYVDFNGTYGEQHAHSFTYTVNGGKLTATCTDGCSDGYDDNPLTLTLTPPTSLVYDGNAKAFTFADGEADAWTSAGLGLPTIAYAAKSGSSLTDNKAVNAGSYTANITVDANKTASFDFEITKATPYIKTNPAPNDIDLGRKLSESTLSGGYVQVSSTNTTQVGGLFEWTNPDTVPGLDDSEVTEYDVTFTPADTNNFNTVSCKVKIKVNHTHAPVKVNGQAATETASGWKDYYKCDCGALFEDENGTSLIDSLDTWKAEGGNGYIAPLIHTITSVNGKSPTETEAGYKLYYECKNCGKYYEDIDGLIEISDINVWKAEGGNGYIAPNYKIIVGNKTNINIDNNEDVLFTSSADYSKFSRVEIDGTTVDSSNYKVESGSTKVTLKTSYLKTLSVGQHTIDIISTDGGHASTTFTITKNNTSPNPRYDIPNTGVDGVNNHSLLKLSSLSLLAIGAYIVIKKKKDN